MFHKFWEFVKAHPYAIGGGVILLIIVYVLYNSASASSTGGGTVAGQAAPTDAEVQSAAAVQIAGLQAGQANNNLAAQVSANNTNTAAAVTVAGYQAASTNYQTEQAANVAQAGITATENVNLGGQQSQVAISQANDATEAFIAQLTNATTQSGYAAQTAQLQSINATNVAVTQANDNTQLGIAQVGGAVAIQQSNNALTAANTATYYNYKTAENNSGGGGGIGGVIGGILGSFF